MRAIAAGLLAVTVAGWTGAGHADPWDHRGHGDIHRFHEHDIVIWRGGRWVNAWHDGRVGWWWVVGPRWYYYPTPVYPYPDPYLPPGVAVVPAPAGQVWYYCGNPPGYYPYVPQCAMPWQLVQPGAALPPPPSPPTVQGGSAALQSAMQAPLGQNITWENGTITPLRDGHDSNGAPCREFRRTVTIGGTTQEAYGTACRQPDGAWKIVGN